MNTVEQPRRDGFFGCWSNRGNQQSFLSVCVGRRHPSDENLADYAPFHKYPKYVIIYIRYDMVEIFCEHAHTHISFVIMFRYPRTNNRNVIQNEDEIENFQFRRRPTSFLCSNDPKRFTWMAAEQEAANADGTRYQHESNTHYFFAYYCWQTERNVVHFDFEMNGIFHLFFYIDNPLIITFAKHFGSCSD